MFKRLLPPNQELIVFQFDGKQIRASRGDSIAAALLAGGIKSLRTTAVSGAPRGPYCMMGTCYECLVLINGKTVQACVTAVEHGLVVEKVPQGTDSDETG